MSPGTTWITQAKPGFRLGGKITTLQKFIHVVCRFRDKFLQRLPLHNILGFNGGVAVINVFSTKINKVRFGEIKSAAQDDRSSRSCRVVGNGMTLSCRDTGLSTE